MNAKTVLESRTSRDLPELLEMRLTGADLAVRMSDSAWWEGSDERRIFTLTVPNVVEWSFSHQIENGSAPANTPTQQRFALLSEHPILLDHGPTASIYGQDALPDPYRFFLEFHRLVRDVCEIPRDPVRYLNWGGTLNDWLSFVYSRTYLLLSAPTRVVQGASELLEAQSASYIVLPDTKNAQVASRMLLLMGENWAVGDEPRFSVE